MQFPDEDAAVLKDWIVKRVEKTFVASLVVFCFQNTYH